MDKMFIDLELIAAGNGEEFEKALEAIEYRSSKSYLRNIASFYQQREIDEETYRILLDEHNDYKDRVLEELDECYKNKINFLQMYKIDDTNQHMLDYIRRTARSMKTYMIFYYNTEREYLEKEKVCHTYFNECEVIGIKYYQEEYSNNKKRKRTSKAEYIKNYLGVNNLENCILIDKSMVSRDEWNNLKGEAFIYQNRFNNETGNVLKFTR